MRIVYYFYLVVFSCSLNAGRLHDLIRKGNNKAILAILEEEPESIKERDKSGNTALHIAAQSGNVALAELLLENGADPDLTNYFGKTPQDLAPDQDAFALLVLENDAMSALLLKKRKCDTTTDSTGQRRRKIPRGDLHPKIERSILKDGNLVPQACWSRAADSCFGTLSKKNQEANPYGISLLSNNCATFALHPGKEAILGSGKLGKVKLAQLICIDKNSPGADIFLPGAWVAIKHQKESFEKEEIQALERTRLLIGSPIKYSNHNGAHRYACGMQLIQGCTLWDWILKSDPEKKWGLEKFLSLAQSMEQALISQVHSKYISFQDANLDNFMVKAHTNEIAIIDFGNAFLFKSKEKNSVDFRGCCTFDFVTVYTEICTYLYEKDYPEYIQNEFWIEAFDFAQSYFEEYKGKSDMLFIGTSAYGLLYHLTNCVPPFLEEIYGENGADKNNKYIDEDISYDIDDYILDKILVEDK